MPQEEAVIATGIPGAKRVNVIFSQQQYETLQHLADVQNITVSDALRQAISLTELIVNSSIDPETKILLKKGDSIKELRLVK